MTTQLIRGLSNLPPDFQGCVATIGNFDGVHRGHQVLLAELTAHAKTLELPSLVITFEPHPAEFFAGSGAALPRLTRLREKFKALAACDVDKVLVLHFNHKLASLSAEKFVQDILCANLKVKHLQIGDDFRFGKGREGDYEFLKKSGQQYGFTVASMPTMLIEGERVSSTRTRKALAEGKDALAAKLLGQTYSIEGRVVQGDKLGRTLGFPTANINLHRQVTPVAGIYVVRVHGLGIKPLAGVANIGTRPTVDDSKRNLLEVYLFDFNQDIYGRYIRVEFCKKLRDEIRFDNLELLKQQMIKDAAEAHDYFVKQGELQSHSS